MPEAEIALSNEIQIHANTADFACLSTAVYPDDRIEAYLAVGAEDEHEYNLQPGDTFPVGDETWKLDRVETPDTDDWLVSLVRVS